MDPKKNGDADCDTVIRYIIVNPDYSGKSALVDKVEDYTGIYNIEEILK